MENRANYILIGIFASVLFFISLFFIVWYGNLKHEKAFNYYEIFMEESVAGLSVKAPVKFLGVDVIAIDGTKRERPDGRTLDDLMKEAKKKYPNQLFMADISSVEEAVNAEKIGFDIVGTTLVGYTHYTKGNDPVTELEKVIKAVSIPVIGEGNLDTPAKAKKALDLGAFAVVVGGAITRPQQITKKFVTEMEK